MGGMMGNPVDEQCTESKVKDKAGREACSNLCLDYACCFGTFSCSDKTKGDCFVFAACQILQAYPDNLVDLPSVGGEDGAEPYSPSKPSKDGEDYPDDLVDLPSVGTGGGTMGGMMGNPVDEQCTESKVKDKAGREACSNLCLDY